jgi:hypothetical protein
METFITGSQQRLQIHNKEICTTLCAFHAPSDHHMRYWQMLWRDDRALLERICEHGVGHPDPDQIAYIRKHVSYKYAKEQGIHGCDGCCENKRQ